MTFNTVLGLPIMPFKQVALWNPGVTITIIKWYICKILQKKNLSERWNSFFFRYFKDLQVKKWSKWFFKRFFLSIFCNQWCYLHWMFLVKAILQSRWVDCKKKKAVYQSISQSDVIFSSLEDNFNVTIFYEHKLSILHNHLFYV